MNAANLISIVGAQETCIYNEPTETAWNDEIVTYTNFSYNLVKLLANVGGSNNYIEGDKLWNAHGNGDLVHTLYYELITPAIAPNTSSGKATDCHWVNSVAFAAIQYALVMAGTQQCEKKHGRWMEAIMEYLYPVGKRFEELCGKLDSEVALIQSAKSDNRYVCPIMLSQTRWSCCAVPAISAHHSTLQYKIGMSKLNSLTVNVGDDSLVPYKYGTSTPITVNDIFCNVYATNIFLDDAERALMIVADLKYITTDSIENFIDSTSAGNISMDTLTLNHPTKYGMWFLQRAEATDGLTYQIGKVGVKDQFYYGADHGGETIIHPNWQLNSQTTWPVGDIAPYFFRYLKVWESFPFCSNGLGGPKYFWTFGPECHAWNPVKTVNMSRIDTIKFLAVNNCSTWTSGRIYFYTEVLNVLVVYGGVAGYLFGSAS